MVEIYGPSPVSILNIISKTLDFLPREQSEIIQVFICSKESKYVRIAVFVAFTPRATFMTGKVYPKKCLSRWSRAENGKIAITSFTYQIQSTPKK